MYYSSLRPDNNPNLMYLNSIGVYRFFMPLNMRRILVDLAFSTPLIIGSILIVFIIDPPVSAFIINASTSNQIELFCEDFGKSDDDRCFIPSNTLAPPSEPISSIFKPEVEEPLRWWKRLLKWFNKSSNTPHPSASDAPAPAREFTSLEIFPLKKIISLRDGVLRVKPAQRGWYPTEVAHLEGQAFEWTSKQGYPYQGWLSSESTIKIDEYKKFFEQLNPKGIICKPAPDQITLPRTLHDTSSTQDTTSSLIQTCKKNLTKIKNPKQPITVIPLQSPSIDDSNTLSVTVQKPDPDQANLSFGEWQKGLHTKPDPKINYAPDSVIRQQLKIKLHKGDLRYPCSDQQLAKLSIKEVSELCKLPLSVEHPNYFKVIPNKDMLVLRSRNVLVLAPSACASHNPIHIPRNYFPLDKALQTSVDLCDAESQTSSIFLDSETQTFLTLRHQEIQATVDQASASTQIFYPGARNLQWSSTVDLVAMDEAKVQEYIADPENKKLLWGLDGGP
jgi:hypothetical protein